MSDEIQSDEIEIARIAAIHAELLASDLQDEPPPALKARTLAAIAADADSEVPALAKQPLGSRLFETLRPRRLAIGSVAVALAATIIAIVLLPSGVPGAPTIGQASALGDQPPTVMDIAIDASDKTLLDREGDGVVFPNWERAFGWEAIGGRADELNGRETTTTFYDRAGAARRVAYTIVSGPPLAIPADAHRTILKRGDVLYSAEDDDGGLVVAFERLGHTVVVSGDATEAEMLKLAAWTGGGDLPF